MYYQYESVSDKQYKAQKMIAKLKKKQDIEPLEYIDIKKNKAWWAIKWEQNIKQYADFSNRIARGRSYVKNGFVIDFKISESYVSSLVMGSSSKPYNVHIKIEQLCNEDKDKLIELCKNKISSLESLLKADFSKDLQNDLLERNLNLFPSPKEIRVDCSCPDGAIMCKHVIATMFGISSKLASNPILFFKLRGIDVDDLIKASTTSILDTLLENANNKSKRAIKRKDIKTIFNLET